MTMPPHPGRELYRRFMYPTGMSSRKLARQLGVSHPSVCELVAMKRAMTVKMALLLEQRFSLSARDWMIMQVDYDLWLFTSSPAKSMESAHHP